MPVRELNGTEFQALAAQVLKAGHLLRFQASGHSMQPLICDGDFLTAAPFAGKAHLGDVLLVDPGHGRLLAHRVVRIGPGGFLVQADSSPEADGWIPTAQVLGQITIIEHGSVKTRLDAPVQRARSWLWVKLSQHSALTGWLPAPLRARLKDFFFGLQ